MDGLAHPRGWRRWRNSGRQLGSAEAAALFGIASLAWGPVALWPDAGSSAWPSASLGIVALWLARRPGPAGRRALGSIAGTIGLLMAAVQIAVLWLFALFTP